MTNEEAIIMIERLKNSLNYEVTDSQKKMDALNMATVALERTPIPRWIETGDNGYIEDTAIYEFQCSKCKSLAYFRKSFNEIVGGKFCPYCGVYMKEGEK